MTEHELQAGDRAHGGHAEDDATAPIPVKQRPCTGPACRGDRAPLQPVPTDVTPPLIERFGCVGPAEVDLDPAGERRSFDRAERPPLRTRTRIERPPETPAT